MQPGWIGRGVVGGQQTASHTSANGKQKRRVQRALVTGFDRVISGQGNIDSRLLAITFTTRNIATTGEAMPIEERIPVHLAVAG